MCAMNLCGIAGERIYCPLWQGPFSDKRLTVYCDLGIILWISLSCTDFFSWLFYFISFACAVFASRPSNLNLICLVVLENLTNTFWLQKHVDDVFELEPTEKNANCGLSPVPSHLPPAFLAVLLSSRRPFLTHYGGNALEKRTKVTLH